MNSNATSMILMSGYRGDVGSALFKLYEESGQRIAPLNTAIDVKAEMILHLAAKSPPANACEIVSSNILYLQDVIRYAEKNGIKKIIFFSAAAIYGNPDKDGVDEDGPIQGLSLYGISKLLGEEMLKCSPLNVLCLRLPAILGFRTNTNFMSRCYQKLQDNDDLIITNPNKIFNNFISVDNIFEFVSKVKMTNKFDIINLASKKERSLLNVISMLKNELGSKSNIKLSDEKVNFFNIATKNAEKKYGFIPHGTERTLKEWVRARMRSEPKGAKERVIL